MTVPVGLDPHLAFVRELLFLCVRLCRIPQGCEECLRIGSPWVHLRLCLTCGHVGCCDQSPGRHARRHAGLVGHPIIRSFQPGEDWRWCFVHEAPV